MVATCTSKGNYMDSVPLDVAFLKKKLDFQTQTNQDVLQHGHSLWAEIPGIIERQLFFYDEVTQTVVSPRKFSELKKVRAEKKRKNNPWSAFLRQVRRQRTAFDTHLGLPENADMADMVEG
ncbi:MAG: hypothetical protein COV01_02090 [Candidatus Taylorbacteria bacterium CG10_big_fil_rev_8_21_14_0_10_41_48]|uniref:Uncharacterized protein n=1 Tax=Candidatus Taylorbacteria bacterium CG10_big_fil_rev_8_21_14_0_10_41_48 TaxID=1975024 RepID=A0A2M8LCD0_9BACT|nr:MAG: hypothetical protein COV01_02090 [Candidatus Taylorbacteria bacterium CG10_big_fil_rev_8_21_14_0_10_41_48]